MAILQYTKLYNLNFVMALKIKKPLKYLELFSKKNKCFVGSNEAKTLHVKQLGGITVKEFSSIGFAVVRDFCNIRKSAKNVKRNISSYILNQSRTDDSNPPAGSRDVDQRGLPSVGSEI